MSAGYPNLVSVDSSGLQTRTTIRSTNRENTPRTAVANQQKPQSDFEHPSCTFAPPGFDNPVI